MATLFVSYYEKRFKAPLCSCTTLTVLVIYLLAIICPFMFAYYTHGKLPFLAYSDV